MSTENSINRYNMLTLEDIQNMFNFSLRQAKALTQSDGFPCVKINGKYFIPEYMFEKWLTDTKEVHMKTI